MKKFIIFWVAVCLAFFSSAAVFASAEEGAPRIYAADCTATQGGYAYVDIKAENLSDVGSMEVYVSYDTSVFAYNSSSENGLNAGNICEVADDSEEGVITLLSLSLSGMNGSGDLWRITFSVAKDAPAGQYTLRVAVGEVTSSGREPLEVGSGNGKITVKESSVPVQRMYIYANAGPAAHEGEETSATFYTNNACGVAAADFEVEYDASRLHLEEVSLGAALTGANNALWSVNSQIAGYIKVSYIAPQGVTGSASPLLVCRFTVVGNVEEKVPVILSASSMYDSAQNGITASDATANISTLYREPVVDYPDISVSGYSGTDGQFAVTVSAEGETALAAGDFVVQYDVSVLQCLSVVKAEGDSVVIINPNYTEGEVRFSFVDEDGIAEDTAMVVITFAPLVSQGETQVTVSGKTLVDADFNDVSVECVPADIAITGHAWGEWTQTKAPTCTESGEEQRVCANNPSHVETRTVAALGHDIVHHEGKEATCTEAGWGAYDTCSRCDYTTYKEIPATGHTLSEWIVDKPATCEEAESRHKECTVCHEVLKTEEIPAKGHAWGEWTQTKAPTCTEAGEEQRVCANDSSHVETRSVAALGHDIVHHEGKEATCTEAGWGAYDTCSRCDYTTYKEIPATGHTSSEWIVDTPATCEEAGSRHKECTVCHEVLETEEIPATGHAWGEWVQTKAPSCTESGEEQRVCANDSSHVETRAVEKLGHDIVHHDGKEATCTEAGWEAYDTCSRCDYSTYKEIPAKGHAWGEWIVDKPATCEEAGSRHKECTVCHEVLERETIPATGHAWSEWTQTKAPTCTESGEKQRVCANDSSHVETRSIAALGHDIVHHEGKEATCTEAGWGAYDTCSRCDYTTYKEIPATGHTSSEWIVDTPATCEEAGSRHKECTVCHEVLETEEIPATGHAWGEWVQTKAPTCTESGDEQRVCANDSSHVETRSVEALGHDIIHHDGQAATCTEAGWGAYETCSHCDYTTYKEIPATGHTAGEWIVDTPATCEEAGSRHKECTVCHEVLKTEEIPATGHAWGEWAQTKAPTCTEAGEEQRVCANNPSHVETRSVEALGHDIIHHEGKEATCTEAGWGAYETCSRCDYTTYKEIPATGHTSSEWIVDKSATCEEVGSRHKECTVCHEVLKTEEIPAKGHAWGEWVQTKAPTCTESGEKQRVCANNPSHVETRPVEALGHEFVDGECIHCGQKGSESTVTVGCNGTINGISAVLPISLIISVVVILIRKKRSRN